MAFFPAILMCYQVHIKDSACSMHNIRKSCLKLMVSCCRSKKQKDTVATRVGAKVEEIIVAYDDKQ